MNQVILASASPRRLELLRMLGYHVETVISSVDEDTVTAPTPAALAETLARCKGEAVAQQLPSSDRPVIAADTLVEVDGRILGKPRSEKEAIDMLTQLSGTRHYVHTGLAVFYRGECRSLCESAAVCFRPLTSEEIASYVASGEPMDKAGAYGIQGRAGAFVERIEGDYYAIMGLPLCRLSTILRELTASDPQS